MGKCSVCKKKIMYNKYKMYRGKILCPECYNTRLDRKAAKKAEVKARAEAIKIVAPSKKAKKSAKRQGIDFGVIPEELHNGDSENDTEKETEDST